MSFLGDAVGGVLGDVTGGITEAGGLNNKYQATGINGMQFGQQFSQTQTALNQQQDFLAALQAANGVGNQSSVFNQLQGVANGTGPNPAQAQLANATGTNAATQAALMAGQRGAGANTGLIARQAAMQGGALQQQAAGQAAALQANQSLGALNQLGGIANSQVQNQANVQQAYNQNLLGQQQAFLHDQQAQSGVNADVAAGNTATRNKIFGQLTGAASQAIMPTGAPAMAQGGMVPGPKSHAAQYFASGGMAKPVTTPQLAAQGAVVPGQAAVKGDSLKNDTVPAILSPGEIVIPRSVVQGKDPVGDAAKFVQAILAKKGK